MQNITHSSAVVNGRCLFNWRISQSHKNSLTSRGSDGLLLLGILLFCHVGCENRFASRSLLVVATLYSRPNSPRSQRWANSLHTQLGQLPHLSTD
ncbi:Uncharacterised protein [Vibrio cholerae]|uniref:Uncharacterized protein n=1 Tax=Vibrio cholerae TaxID=666 RepID=A0A655XMC9_VIBCL|nr:Uncharacterised protein [Vibrio cholerae]CSC90695.1 Uncharacterised protein [Vibrio cholerae]CSD14790.1 Uncharacterised protein [Vibrio cholerae]CSI58797.1 Uncharacterised protein [Vibrio cholerae]